MLACHSPLKQGDVIDGRKYYPLCPGGVVCDGS